MILSFHPCIEADVNMICAGREPGEQEIAAIQSANAVIIPQGCRESLYQIAKKNCRHVFPNYDMLFQYPGKIGQAKLFQKLNVPHPKTLCYDSIKDVDSLYKSPPFNYPFVFKLSWGGEGRNVFLVQSIQDFDMALDITKQYEKSGQKGFLLQEYIHTNGKSLRVVIIGHQIFSYWRIQSENNGFYSNVAKGAKIDYHSNPHQQAEARKSLIQFCTKTGINLAGFDFIFSETDPKRIPLFLEINYFFGRKGLGGTDNYYKLLESSVKEWIKIADIKIKRNQNTI